MRVTFILPCVSRLRPLQQGTLSRLCGVYSILNALQLSLHPQRLTKLERQTIYLHAIAYLARRRQLKRVLGVGMDHGLWWDLRDALIAHVNAVYHVSLKPMPTLSGTAAIDRQRTVGAIKREVRRGRPVLAVFGGALDHYSVICGYTPQRLMLFDSSGLSWIIADNLGLGEHSRRRYTLCPRRTSTIIHDW
ncbi:MAG: hypothetical protein ABIP67_03130 [Burkholderiales bacterium]